MKYSRLILSAFALLFLLASVNAAVDRVIIQYNGQNYDYAVIEKTYDLFIAGSNLQNISNNSQLSLISNDESVAHYTFVPGNTAGIRTFNDGVNSFDVSILSEADELADSIGSVTIKINDNNSTVKINNLNLSNKIIRAVNLSKISELKSISGNLDLSNILRGLAFNLGFIKGQKYPTYHSLSIDGGSSAGTVINAILTFNNINCNGFICDTNDINANPEKLNQVIDKYNANAEYMANATAIKQGNDFSFYTDEGYSNLNGTNLKNAQEIINDKIKFINPDEVIDVLLPIKNFSEFKKFVDFNVSVDFGSLTIEDGNYTLKALYEDKYGNKGEMPFTVVLDITNTAPSEKEVNGTIVFSDIIVNQTLQKVENLPSNVSLAVVLFGKNKPSAFQSAPSNVDALNYIQIDSSNTSATSSGAFDLYFKILKTSISSSDKNDVSLYVEEGSSWTILPTSLVNESSSTYYEYKAITPHFSNFMIGVIQPITSSSGGSSGNSGTIYEFGKNINNNQTNKTVANPINLGGTPPEASPGFFAAITGAIIGALGTGGTIFVVVFIVGIVGAMIVLRVGRKTNKKGKGKKLNDRGDEVDES